MAHSEPQNTIRLPRVVVTATVAQVLFDDADLDSTNGTSVTIFARAVSTSSASFTRRLLELLVEAGFNRVEVKGTNRRLTNDLFNAALPHDNLTLSFPSR